LRNYVPTAVEKQLEFEVVFTRLLVFVVVVFVGGPLPIGRSCNLKPFSMASATDSSGPVEDTTLPLSNNSVRGGSGSVDVSPSAGVGRDLDGGPSVARSPPGQPSPLNPKPGPTLRKFQKANSAATFLLDGMAYTIGMYIYT